MILHGDCLDELKKLPDNSVHTCVTSPPYWGLRDYGVDGQIGLEKSPDEYVQKMVEVFREVRRVLRDDGTLWLNLGDSYAGSNKGYGGKDHGKLGKHANDFLLKPLKDSSGLKQKDLVGIPWRVAFALQADGWYLRSDIIWNKPNCLSGGTILYAKTQKGEMPMTIKDLVRLDPKTVKLWNGEKWTQVVQWLPNPRPENPIEIELRNGQRIGCTPDHLWQTERGLLRADQLKIGDIVPICKLPEPESPKTPKHVPSEIGWFVGLYIAEGSRSGNCIQISSHVNEISRFERLKEIAEMYGGTCRMHSLGGNTATINLHGKMLEAIIDTYVSGENAHTKHLSVECWKRENKFLDYLLHGYLSGDGHFDKPNSRWRLGLTRNYNLESDLRTLCARLGYTIRLKMTTSKNGDKEYPVFRGEIRFKKSEHHNNKPDGEIVRIGRSRATQFWDISVADDPHLFSLASGVLTHNCMPESVKDRPTKAHEYIFLFSKSPKYYYDADAIREPLCEESTARAKRKERLIERTGKGTIGKQVENGVDSKHGYAGLALGRNGKTGYNMNGRNKRTVWSVSTKPFKGAHFAVFPPDLIEPCILAGSPEKACPHCGAPWERKKEKVGEFQRRWSTNNAEGSPYQKQSSKQNIYETTGLKPTCQCENNDGSGRGLVLDPFFGSGTTGVVALQNNRQYIGIELNPEYIEIANERLKQAQPTGT